MSKLSTSVIIMLKILSWAYLIYSSYSVYQQCSALPSSLLSTDYL